MNPYVFLRKIESTDTTEKCIRNINMLPLVICYSVPLVISNTFTLNYLIFLTIYFIAFDFVIFFDLNSNSNNLIEILSDRAFLVDCLVK